MGTKINFTEEQEDKIVNLFEKECGGCKKSFVAKMDKTIYCSKGCSSKNHVVWEKQNEIIEMYNSFDMSIIKISKKLNCSHELIRRILYRNNIGMKARGSFLLGRTYDEIYGKEGAKILKNKISDNSKTNPNYGMGGKHHKESTKIKIGIESKGRKHTPKSIRRAVETRMRNGSYNHKESTKIKIGLSQRGEKHYNWKGGITPVAHKRVKDRNWIKIANEIRKRDNNTCKMCGKEGDKRLPVHHIIPFRISKDNAQKNLITLCQSCHMVFENKVKDLGYLKLQDLLSERYGYVYTEQNEVIVNLNEIK